MMSMSLILEEEFINKSYNERYGYAKSTEGGLSMTVKKKRNSVTVVACDPLEYNQQS